LTRGARERVLPSMLGVGARGLVVSLVLCSAALFQACGGSSENEPAKTDGGKDAGADALPDAPPDAKSDAPTDAPGDSPAIQPGLGEACDGLDGNPDGCPTGLNCYLGTDPGDDPERWPEGYCTKSCTSSSQCAAWGGVCQGGGFGPGQCLKGCAAPVDCRKGYACVNPSAFGAQNLACAPTGFIAVRGPGEACFQHTDPSAPNYLAELPSTHFSANEKFDSVHVTANEIALGIDDSDNLVVGANALSGGGYDNPAWYGPGSATPLNLKSSLGPKSAFGDYSDPYIVTGADGTFYYSTLGLGFGNAQVLVAHSSDQGATWTTAAVNPTSDCTLGTGQDSVCLDHPWLAVGPDALDLSQEAVYAAYLATRPSDYVTVIIRSTDGGQTWGIPGAPGESLAMFSYNDDSLFTNLITPAVDAQGVVHVVASDVGFEPKGSVSNAVVYARSEDGGKTHTPFVRVNPVTQPVPYEQPAIAVDDGNIYVAYVAGQPDGAWDVFLARSSDGQTWTGEKVNDEPEACATHFHVALAVDTATHRLYVAWYDGRFAPYEGSVAISVCDPNATGKLCGPNEAITDATFFVTTDRNGFAFIGDYFSLAARPNGNVWAGFGDTRENGVSHGYVAHGVFP
jgi:hypothetical protein